MTVRSPLEMMTMAKVYIKDGDSRFTLANLLDVVLHKRNTREDNNYGAFAYYDRRAGVRRP